MELTLLLEQAKEASPTTRIQWRDRIASYGARAIDATRLWLTDTVLAAFAVRVIERAGANGAQGLAIDALRSSRSRVPLAVRSDVDWALKRLRPTTKDTPVGDAARIEPSSRRPVTRGTPCTRTVAYRRSRYPVARSP